MQRRQRQIQPTDLKAKAVGIVRELRKQAGHSRERLSADCGFDRTYISRLERGILNPTVSRLWTIADVLETPLSKLTGEMELWVVNHERTASRRGETRFTSLDRTILRNARTDERGFVLTQPKLKQHISARLVVLSRMGMAKRDEQGTWVLKSDMEPVLRAMQRARDRQKTLFAQGALVSDQRLPIEVMDWQQMKTIEGRVLMHGEDEQSGKRFMMLESTSAKVLFIEYAPEMDGIRG